MQYGAAANAAASQFGSGRADPGGPLETLGDLGTSGFLRGSETRHATGAVPRIGPTVPLDSTETVLRQHREIHDRLAYASYGERGAQAS